MPSLKAWRTKAAGIESIVCAETRAQAVSDTQRAAREAGWDVEFTAIAVRRAPEHDLFAATNGIRGRCIGEEYAR